ncbi:hypothetical protein GF318_05585 [Candidatus Micrarchaeota archaeon]|nr:hypothetical protein [Candidatus Micrarchaeota archaeon]
MEDKKLVLPGDYLASVEEAETGENTYEKDDEIYSAAMGEFQVSEGSAEVRRRDNRLKALYPGMQVYGLIFRTSLNKAIATCVPVDEMEGKMRSIEFEGVLPVTEIRKSYVKDIRDEVKIGDIILAKINKITSTGPELTIVWPEYGLAAVFCPRCRTKMDLKDRTFVCGQCGWEERRKIPAGRK